MSGPGEAAPNHVELGHRVEQGQFLKLHCMEAIIAQDVPLALEGATPMHAQVIR